MRRQLEDAGRTTIAGCNGKVHGWRVVEEQAEGQVALPSIGVEGQKNARVLARAFVIGNETGLRRRFFGSGGFGLRYGPVGCAYFEAGEAADADVFAEF